MALNYIWIALFIIGFLVGVIKLLMGDYETLPAMMDSTFEMSKDGFEMCLGLTGTLVLWMGILKIGEDSGLINKLASFLSPVLTRLFPEIPKGHPVTGSIFMNIAANMLGLDNAATPLGLKAMEQMQELNTKKDTASNSMIMFLVLNTSGLTLIPVSIMVYRVQMGAAQPTDIFSIDNGAINNWIVDDKSCPIDKGGRVKMTDQAQLVRTIDTFYNDVDINGHINSVKYIEHVLDLWSLDWYKEHQIKRFEIAYVAEAHAGDKLSFYREESADGEFCVRIVKNGDVEVVRSKVKFV